MAKLLLNLRHVPDDEAEEVREMLDAAEIEYYETPPNRWGITVGGIWVRDEDDMPRARSLMADYQQERQARALEEREARRREGREESFWGWLSEQPVRVVASLLGAAFIVYLMLLPFLGMLGNGSGS
jgi:hypothetical protein